MASKFKAKRPGRENWYEINRVMIEFSATRTLQFSAFYENSLWISSCPFLTSSPYPYRSTQKHAHIHTHTCTHASTHTLAHTQEQPVFLCTEKHPLAKSSNPNVFSPYVCKTPQKKAPPATPQVAVILGPHRERDSKVLMNWTWAIRIQYPRDKAKAKARSLLGN